MSEHIDDFVLKGGMLLAAMGTRRPTVDADTLARNISSDEDSIARRVAEIAMIDDPEDGVVFLPDTITTSVIRDGALYSGVRVTMSAQLATANLKLRLDINFGDPITPAPRPIELPSLRSGTPPITVLGYPIETVLAEKLVTAVDLGQANTRARDYVDVHLLTNTQSMRCGTLRDALSATAEFRGTTLRPLAEYASGLGKLRASTYVAYRNGLGELSSALPDTFSELIAVTAAFIDPVINGLHVEATWLPAVREWRIS